MKGVGTPRRLAGGTAAVVVLAALTVGPTVLAGSGAVASPDPTLTVTLTGNGSVTTTTADGTLPQIACDPTNTPCSQSYPSGTDVTLHEQPGSSADHFGAWGGDCVAAMDPCVLNMSADKSAIATFTGPVAQGTPTPVPPPNTAAPTGTPYPGGYPNLVARCKSKFDKGKKRSRCIKKAKKVAAR